VKQQSADHNGEVAARLGIDAEFVVGSIGEATLDEAPDVVLALHACDTATDDALARAVGWEAAVVLAAPCCHHDIAGQLRTSPAPAPYAVLTRDGILRERFADTLTDALRASLLRAAGYRVDVVEFVESAHTPRNTLLRATRTGAAADRSEHDELVSTWGVRPRLAELLDHPRGDG
jgi:Methyltransferase domain